MPYKISFWIVIFLLFFNGGAVLLDASGAAGYLGVDPETGGGDELDNATSDVTQFQTGTGQGQTLFGLYNSLEDALTAAMTAIFPAAQMMQNIGVPNYITAWAFTGLVAVPGFDLIVFLRSG